MSSDPDFYLRFQGRRALYAVPHLRADPYTSDVPPPSAVKGMVRAIHWKPEYEWIIRSIAVEREIRKTTMVVKVVKGSNTWSGQSDDVSEEDALWAQALGQGKSGRQMLTCLVDVSYVVGVTLDVNQLRTARPKIAYLEQVRRQFERGGFFRAPCLGRNEFQATYEQVTNPNDIRPIPLTRDLGPMLWDLVPEDLGDGKLIDTKRQGSIGKYAKQPDKFKSVYFNARLDNGVLTVPPDLYARHRDQIHAVRNRAHPNNRNDDREVN